MRILFLCVANSARSQMAEGLAKNIFGTNHDIFSAGSCPTKPNPFAINVMDEIGIDISKQTSDHVDNYINENIDLVISLCAEEFCPTFNNKIKHLHWPLKDPDSKGIKLSNDTMIGRFSDTRDEIKALLQGLSKIL